MIINYYPAWGSLHIDGNIKDQSCIDLAEQNHDYEGAELLLTMSKKKLPYLVRRNYEA